MSFLLQPWHLLLLSVAGWVNRQQQDAIAYLRTENQILRENLGKKRILLNDDQRRRMAVKGKVLGHKLLGEVGTLFTPDTEVLLSTRCVTDIEKSEPAHCCLKRPRPRLTSQAVLSRDAPARCGSPFRPRFSTLLVRKSHIIRVQDVGSVF
jgi:hypothetical protein